MHKLGYVTSCLGLRTTSALLNVPYRQMAEDFFNHDLYTSTHLHRLQLVVDILSKGGATVTGPNVTAWFTTPTPVLRGQTPMQFISTMKPGVNRNEIRALILNAPIVQTRRSVHLAA